MKKSFTLIELIIAVLLMGAIILAAMSFNLASDQFLTSSIKKGAVLNDLTFLLEHIQKNITSGSGDITDGGHRAIQFVDSGSITLTIYQDIDSSGNLNLTPEDYSDDRRVEYIFNYDDHTVTFEVVNSDDSTSSEVLLTNLVSDDEAERLSMEYMNDNTGVRISNLFLRLDPEKEYDPRYNPQVSIDQQIFFSPGQSVS